MRRELVEDEAGEWDHSTASASSRWPVVELALSLYEDLGDVDLAARRRPNISPDRSPPYAPR